MKNDLMKLVRWFCRKLTYNDLASVVPMLQELLSGSRKDLDLKPEKELPPHYRQFRVDPAVPLTEPPVPEDPVADWRQIQEEHEQETGKRIAIVRRRKGSAAPPEKCACAHCHAPARYLYLNNGRLGSQVRCKICGRTSPTHKPRREGKARYWCPHCGYALFRWKEDGICTCYKCPNAQCPCYRNNLASLTPEEKQMRQQGNTSQFKLRYIFREYHFSSEQLPLARSQDAPVDFNRIHHGLHTVGTVLTLTVSFGLSARMSSMAMRHLFGVRISHQSIINYTKAAAAQLGGFVAYYNFMRPHGALKGRPPVELECLKDRTLYPDQWVELLRQAGLDAVRRQVA